MRARAREREREREMGGGLMIFLVIQFFLA